MDVDAEAVAVGTILHDIGLTAGVPGPNRFEVNGAAAAVAFVKERGVSNRRAQLDSITNLPLLFSTAITIASLCTSIPMYLTSRLIALPP